MSGRPTDDELVWRGLTADEVAVLSHLLRADFAGRDELAAQATLAKVRVIDAEGSLKFLAQGPVASVSERVPVEGWYHDGEPNENNWRPAVHLLVHVIDGLLDELEVYKDDGSPIVVGPLNVRVEDIMIFLPKGG